MKWETCFGAKAMLDQHEDKPSTTVGKGWICAQEL